jgi:glycosyltransferase involved in cell wall biosynthesis
MNTLISIIITCYNDANFIEKAVNSAFNQTYFNTEIIVIDDGSNEDTKVVLTGLKKKISRLITQENSGQSSARNKGINLALGEYILVLDSDDYFESTFAEKAIKIISQNDEFKIITCWGRRVSENNEVIDIFKPGGGELKSFLPQNGSFGSCLIRKSDWEKVGGYDESMTRGFEDWEFFIRILADGGIAYVLPEILFNYRVRKRSTTTRANKIKYELKKSIIEKNKEVFKKHHLEHSYYLLDRIDREEREKYKVLASLEYRIGHLSLKTLRLVKKLLFQIFTIK